MNIGCSSNQTQKTQRVQIPLAGLWELPFPSSKIIFIPSYCFFVICPRASRLCSISSSGASSCPRFICGDIILLRPYSSMKEIIARGIPTGTIQDNIDAPIGGAHVITPTVASANIKSRTPIMPNINPKMSFRFLDELISIIELITLQNRITSRRASRRLYPSRNIWWSRPH